MSTGWRGAYSRAAGVVSGSSDEYVLRRFDADGNETGRLTRDIEKPELTDATRDAFIADMQARDTTGRIDYARLLEFPDRKPYFEQVYADPDGTVLVLRYRDKAAPTTLDVFSSDGTFLHEVTLDDFPGHPVFRGGERVRDPRRPGRPAPGGETRGDGRDAMRCPAIRRSAVDIPGWLCVTVLVSAMFATASLSAPADATAQASYRGIYESGGRRAGGGPAHRRR